MPTITDLIQLSRYAGERFDLVQANSGNASLKTSNGTMFIKAGGGSLSDISSESDLCEVNLDVILKFLADNVGAEKHHDESFDFDRAAVDCLLAASKAPGKRPSNETFLHALLGPLTLHSHPPVVTSIICQRGWREKIASMIPEALFVDYHTPGARAALATAEVLKKSKWKSGDQVIIFMENHGLLVSAENAGEVAAITNDVVSKLSYFIGVDWSRFRLSNRISDLILSTSGELVCSYLSEDRLLLHAARTNPSVLLAQPVFPDQLVYSGPAGLELGSLDDEKPLVNYIERYEQLPRVILYRASSKLLFIVADTMRKCRDIEQVLKAHVMTLMSASMPNVQFLSDDELIHLMNWEAEKYKRS